MVVVHSLVCVYFLEQHNKNVAAYNKQRQAEEQRARQEVSRKQEVDSDLWERLAQLEKLEEDGGEMNR